LAARYAMEYLKGTDQVAEAYRVTGVPCLFFIDRDGIIRQVELGIYESLVERLDQWIDANR